MTEDRETGILEIPISEIDDFPGHPFHVQDGEDLRELAGSIRARGVLTPALVRRKEDGRYEMISGHRRKRACEIAGLETLRCEVVDTDRDEAVILMVESNFQRSDLLPSEKAFAYKMRLEAMKRQGNRSDLTSPPLGEKLSGRGNWTSSKIGKEQGDSQEQVRRYIRLTELVPELLDLVDEGRMKMRPAVELSYLDKDSQREVAEQIEFTQGTPTHDQAIRMRRLCEAGSLTPGAIAEIMAELKPSQREKFVFSGEKLRPYLPKRLPPEGIEEYVCKALDHYRRYLRARENSR